MKTTHTPGPWRIFEMRNEDCELDSCIYAEEESKIATCEQWNGALAEQSLANARLIAAAPDLLKALDALCKAEEDYGDPSNAAVNEAWLNACRVVANAKGE